MADSGRARKVAERIKDTIAENLDAVVKDPDLGFVTITDVRVTGDVQHASVFYTVFESSLVTSRSARPVGLSAAGTTTSPSGFRSPWRTAPPA